MRGGAHGCRVAGEAVGVGVRVGSGLCKENEGASFEEVWATMDIAAATAGVGSAKVKEKEKEEAQLQQEASPSAVRGQGPKGRCGRAATAL